MRRSRRRDDTSGGSSSVGYGIAYISPARRGWAAEPSTVVALLLYRIGQVMSRRPRRDSLVGPPVGAELRLRCLSGETLSPELHTSIGNFKVPIALPPGRGGFQPELTLAYSTGFGNGPFGLGWSLDVPSITRKTSQVAVLTVIGTLKHLRSRSADPSADPQPFFADSAAIVATRNPPFPAGFRGADERARTVDLLHGKQTLYQLSYIREPSEYSHGSRAATSARRSR